MITARERSVGNLQMRGFLIEDLCIQNLNTVCKSSISSNPMWGLSGVGPTKLGHVWQPYTQVFLYENIQLFCFHCFVTLYHQIFGSSKYQKIGYFKGKSSPSIFNISNIQVFTSLLRKQPCLPNVPYKKKIFICINP